MEGSTYVELKGSFVFAINQFGLDYNNPKEREEAIRDFWKCWETFAEKVRDDYISFKYNEDDLKVKKGE